MALAPISSVALLLLMSIFASAGPVLDAEAGDGPVNLIEISEKEAYKLWRDDPKGVMLVQVGSVDECACLGYVPTLVHGPLFLWPVALDGEKKDADLAPVPDYLFEFKNRRNPCGTIIIKCRSRTLEDKAIGNLLNAGFKNIGIMRGRR